MIPRLTSEENYYDFTTKIFGGGEQSFSNKISNTGELRKNMSEGTVTGLKDNISGYCRFMLEYVNFLIPPEVMPKHYEKIVLYRAIGASKKTRFVVDQEIEMPIPSSGTHSLEYAYEHARKHVKNTDMKVIFIFNVHLGHPLLYMSIPDSIKETLKHVSRIHKIQMVTPINESQREILLPPGKYKVVETNVVGDILFVTLQMISWYELHDWCKSINEEINKVYPYY